MSASYVNHRDIDYFRGRGDGLVDGGLECKYGEQSLDPRIYAKNSV